MRLLVEHCDAVRVDVVLHHVQLDVVAVVSQLYLLVWVQDFELRQLELLVERNQLLDVAVHDPLLLGVDRRTDRALRHAANSDRVDQVEVPLHFLGRGGAALEDVVCADRLLSEHDLPLQVPTQFLALRNSSRCVFVYTWQVLVPTQFAIAVVGFVDGVSMGHELAVVAGAGVAAVAVLLLLENWLQFDLGKQVGVMVFEVISGDRAVQHWSSVANQVVVAIGVIHFAKLNFLLIFVF